MTVQEINLDCFNISEEQFENLAAEFLGRVEFPAGNHRMGVVKFCNANGETSQELFREFLKALQCFKRQTP